MSCEKYRELFSANLDGELSSEEYGELEFHLGECSRCRNFTLDLSDMRARADSSEVESIPVELEDKILSRTVKASNPKSSLFDIFKGHYQIPRGLVWAGALALILLTANAIIEPFDSSQNTPDFTIEMDPDALVIQKVKLTEKDMVSTSSITKRANGS